MKWSRRRYDIANDSAPGEEQGSGKPTLLAVALDASPEYKVGLLLSPDVPTLSLHPSHPSITKAWLSTCFVLLSVPFYILSLTLDLLKMCAARSNFDTNVGDLDKNYFSTTEYDNMMRNAADMMKQKLARSLSQARQCEAQVREKDIKIESIKAPYEAQVRVKTSRSNLSWPNLHDNRQTGKNLGGSTTPSSEGSVTDSGYLWTRIIGNAAATKSWLKS